jgi:uncharacterized protein YbjQ (UPF0145 family)
MSGPFTSDLSMDEILLIEELGFDPVQVVFGSSFYHIGFQWAGWSTNEELGEMTGAMNAARHDAMARLEAQVQACGADGVVGTRITVEHHHHHAQFFAIGTAVRRRDGDHEMWRQPDGRPFTSDLSGQDLYKLVKAGYAPRALVMGNCVYHIAHQGLLNWFATQARNVEMENFTTALYGARELAMGRMQAEAERAGGDGIVGVGIREGSYSWGSHIIEFFALGTAVASVAPHDPAVNLVFDTGSSP